MDHASLALGLLKLPAEEFTVEFSGRLGIPGDGIVPNEAAAVVAVSAVATAAVPAPPLAQATVMPTIAIAANKPNRTTTMRILLAMVSVES